MPPCEKCCKIDCGGCCPHSWGVENVHQHGFFVAVVLCSKCKVLKRPIYGPERIVELTVEGA